MDGEEDELVYKITFDVPDAGLLPDVGHPEETLGDNNDDTVIAPVPGAEERRYPTHLMTHICSWGRCARTGVFSRLNGWR